MPSPSSASILELLVRPARDLGSDAAGQLIYTEVTELLTTSVKVSFVGGFILALPVILYQVIMFGCAGADPPRETLPAGGSCRLPSWHSSAAWPSPTLS